MAPSFFLPFLITFLTSSIATKAIVPPSKTFKYVNQGSLGEYFVEYSTDYRTLDIVKYPFTLCFYNATPNAFILGLRMGHRRSESVMRWVWDANRDVDGTVAWQTNTANKGVLGLDLLPNGNLVLYDSKGKYVWQSFNHPSDTLLVGQALKASGGPTRLVSRLSITEPASGPYTFVMEQRHWAMYYQTKDSQKPLLYYKSNEFGNGKGTLAYLSFYCEPEYGGTFAFELGFRFNLSNSNSFGTNILSRPKYNSTYTMLRVDTNGNLRMYTYNTNVDWGAWEVTYELFDRDNDRASECQLPKRCGSLGVCDHDQCVACPRPQGLLGWSTACTEPMLPPCKGGSNADYYKVDGVEHFTSAYNEGSGPMKLAQCRDECSKNCKCLGFFYRMESSKCLMVPELGTLIKVSDPSHVGYIKISK
ncbi:Hypothetical predicted protein [Olea europaea subsp. europaea]|uniref:Apple domain-containing protein n=1 Tax=Olea europaea subsp. europaea TaxID=158383 RepID=A0A8S0T0H3_OLEEU|nr:Hypothetical predicted protein [Olea europaea subsp. europaea]